MKKIAIVIQRYGKEVSGGGEFYARELAKQLRKSNYVSILTTTSLDLTFAKHYEAGEYEEDGIKIIRFDNKKARNFARLETLSNDETNNIKAGINTTIGVDLQWVEEWGPCCPNLIKYVETSRNDYDAFIVFTYIYYTSIHVIPIVRDKVIFIPTAHDEIWARPTIFKKIFNLPRFICFLTKGEEDFVRSFYNNTNVNGDIIGCGVELPAKIDNQSFRKKYHIDDDYIVYVGRVDPSKGCDLLIKYFIEYKRKYNSPLKLVLIGDRTITCENNKDIIFMGFVSEQIKFDCISGALLSVAPSEFESLCIAVLESFACSKPILANGKCKILLSHCKDGQNGLGYNSKEEFIEKLHYMLKDKKRLIEMGQNAKKYLDKNYTWGIVTSKINNMIDYIVDNPLKASELPNNSTEELAIRDVFLDRQLDSEVIYANKRTRIKPYYDDAVAVCFTSSDYFAPICAVAVASLIKNFKDDRNCDILILTSGMSTKNKIGISRLAKKNVSIRFVEFEDGLFSEEIATHDSYNIYTYYRLMIPTICSDYKKVLYLDSDMVINRDVSEIYDVNIDGYYTAAVLDLTILTWQAMGTRHWAHDYLTELNLMEQGTYMQGGVALYNIGMINSSYSIDYLIKKANERHYQNCDQELLNICFKGKIKFLSEKWNTVVMHVAYVDLYDYWMPKKYYDRYIEARKDPYIIHYSFQQIPCYNTRVDMHEYFWKYARETSFYEELMMMVASKMIVPPGVPPVIAPPKAHPLSEQPVGITLDSKKSRKRRIIDFVLPHNTKRREFVKRIVKHIVK